MTIIKKPDYNIFASEAKTGEIVDFPNLLRGWGVTLDQTAGKPPMEWFNALQKRTDEWLTYLSQRGLPEWQNTLDYPKDAVVQFGGKFFVAKKDNKASQPDRSQNDWAILLGTAASRDVGTAAGNVMEVGAFGLGMGARQFDDAYCNTAQIYRVNKTSKSAPGNSTYGVLSLPQDGAPSAGYFAAGQNGEAYVGRSTTAEGGVRWSKIYTTDNKPSGLLLNTLTFTASGTYRPTIGAKFIRITLTGGGGGGCQATSSSQTYFGAGGGAGATVISQFILTGATSYPVTIGVGGDGGVSASPGGNGGATAFSTLFSAPGGLGATKTGATNTGGGYGGIATDGDIRINGGDGGDGQTGTTAVGGQGGSSYFGGGGRAGAGGGIDGKAPGSGGGGAYDVGYSGVPMNGGKGASGLIIIEEYS